MMPHQIEENLSSVTSPSVIKFSHPAEETFARILDFYGIRWVYEPRTFPLEWDKNGNVIEAFAPDFYLPEQDLYIELTTLRPRCTQAFNRCSFAFTLSIASTTKSHRPSSSWSLTSAR